MIVNKGMDTEGLYREPGSVNDVKALKAKFDEGKLKLHIPKD